MTDYLKLKISFCKQDGWAKWLIAFSQSVLNDSYFFESKVGTSLTFEINENPQIATSYSIYTTLSSFKYMSAEEIEHIASNYNIDMVLKSSFHTYITTEYDIYSISFVQVKESTPTYAKSSGGLYFNLIDTSYVKLSIGTFNYLYASIIETSYVNIADEITFSVSTAANISMEGTTYTTYYLKLTLFKTDNINKLSRFENFTLDDLMLYNLFELSYNNIW